MKKVIFLLSSLCLAGVLVITSCSKKSSDDPVVQKPSLVLQQGTGYISSDVTVAINSQLTFGVRAMLNSSSNSPLTEMILSRAFKGNTQTLDSLLNNLTSFNVDFGTEARNEAGQETFTFTIKDKAGQSNTLSVIVTTTTTLTKGMGTMVRPKSAFFREF